MPNHKPTEPTGGKWEITALSFGAYLVEAGEKAIALVYQSSEAKANALIMSKAKVMFELIDLRYRLCACIGDAGGSSPCDWCKKAYQLIKEIEQGE